MNTSNTMDLLATAVLLTLWLMQGCHAEPWVHISHIGCKGWRPATSILRETIASYTLSAAGAGWPCGYAGR